MNAIEIEDKLWDAWEHYTDELEALANTWRTKTLIPLLKRKGLSFKLLAQEGDWIIYGKKVEFINTSSNDSPAYLRDVCDVLNSSVRGTPVNFAAYVQDFIQED